MTFSTRHNPLVIIPARGGSKGIPHKNIKLFGGRPLICWTIDIAKKITDNSHIILSTDDEEIASVAEKEGLPVPYRRPAEYSGDTSGSREVILDAMQYADKQGVDYNCILLLQPTSPFREVADVENALELYNSDTTDMVVSVTEAKSNPYYNCFETDKSTGYLKISKGDGLLTRRQDAPAAWEYNGAVYVINPDSIRKMPLGAFPRRIPSPMEASKSIDLDTPTDWIIGETILNLKNNVQ